MMNQETQDSVFLSEWLAANRPDSQLPISAVCNSYCLFCSNHANPFPITKGVFRDVEDVKTQLCLMQQNHQAISLSDCLPGRIAEGEALLHPRLFEILDLVRRRFPTNLLRFTTNASMLDEAFLKALAHFCPIEITVSLHSTQPETWARIFGKGLRHAHTAIGSLARIKAHGMDLAGAIVTLPRVCGWDDVEQTYATFVAHRARRIVLYRPGYTSRTPPEVVADLECPLKEYMGFAERMRSAHVTPVRVCNDTQAPLDVSVDKIMAHTLRGNGEPYRQVLWLTSAAAHARLARLVDEHAAATPNAHYLMAVKNTTYGGNIDVAGLLTVDDFVAAGRQALARWPDVDLILVPTRPFDALFRDLRKTPAYRIADALERPVWLVANAGAYDPLGVRSRNPV